MDGTEKGSYLGTPPKRGSHAAAARSPHDAGNASPESLATVGQPDSPTSSPKVRLTARAAKLLARLNAAVNPPLPSLHRTRELLIQARRERLAGPVLVSEECAESLHFALLAFVRLREQLRQALLDVNEYMCATETRARRLHHSNQILVVALQEERRLRALDSQELLSAPIEVAHGKQEDELRGLERHSVQHVDFVTARDGLSVQTACSGKAASCGMSASARSGSTLEACSLLASEEPVSPGSSSLFRPVDDSRHAFEGLRALRCEESAQRETLGLEVRSGVAALEAVQEMSQRLDAVTESLVITKLLLAQSHDEEVRLKRDLVRCRDERDSADKRAQELERLLIGSLSDAWRARGENVGAPSGVHQRTPSQSSAPLWSLVSSADGASDRAPPSAGDAAPTT